MMLFIPPGEMFCEPDLKLFFLKTASDRLSPVQIELGKEVTDFKRLSLQNKNHCSAGNPLELLQGS